MLISFCIIVHAIEVGGHITENTTWYPANNPYEVIDILYVDSGVTLTILPGTEIKVNGAQLSNYNDYLQNFWLYYGVSVAKYIQVDGRLNAVGTEQDSIVFTRLQDDPNYNWGTIYITENAELCRFKHCIIEHTANIGLALSNISMGLSFYNGTGSIRNCSFINNGVSLSSSSFSKNLEIINNNFIINDEVNIQLLDMLSYHIVSYRQDMNSPELLVCGNSYSGEIMYDPIVSRKASFAFNTIDNCSSSSSKSYYFSNTFSTFNDAINTGYEGDSIYIKQNTFIDGYDAIEISYSYVEISDNYFEDCRINLEFNHNSIFQSNYVENYTPNSALSGNIGVISNNIYVDCSNAISGSGVDQFSNNSFISNDVVFNFMTDTHIIENQIFLQNDNLYDTNIYGNPIFRNCIIDFELEYPLIDGGGNIIVDSLQAQDIFVDIQNGDFHLAQGSIGIDAGFDTLGYYYPFDMDYNHRVWDGDNNGSAIIDIGPYEFGAPSLGGIEGTTYDPITGDFVDYVLIKINNEPGEFTFSDSIGSYQYKLPAGIYEVYAERVFYDDAVEYQIEVVDGQFTQLDIPMCETVDVQDDEMIPVANDFDLSNFPNPFNPETIISFSIKVDNNVELSILNIKGQKVITLINEHLSKGKHSIIWSGCDQNGYQVSSGIYFYKLKVGNQEYVKRMLLLK